jgi:spore coat protein U-like protein
VQQEAKACLTIRIHFLNGSSEDWSSVEKLIFQKKWYKLMKKILCAATVAGIMFSSVSSSIAATTTGQLDVKVTILESCQIDTVGGSTNALLDFGNVNSFNQNVDAVTAGNVSFRIQCNDGVSYSISLNEGLNEDSNQRRMKSATGNVFVNYNLYQDAARSTEWTDSSPVTGTSDGSPVTLPVYGRIPSGQTLPAAGEYTDTVVATVTY